MQRVASKLGLIGGAATAAFTTWGGRGGESAANTVNCVEAPQKSPLPPGPPKPLPPVLPKPPVSSLLPSSLDLHEASDVSQDSLGSFCNLTNVCPYLPVASAVMQGVTYTTMYPQVVSQAGLVAPELGLVETALRAIYNDILPYNASKTSQLTLSFIGKSLIQNTKLPEELKKGLEAGIFGVLATFFQSHQYALARGTIDEILSGVDSKAISFKQSPLVILLTFLREFSTLGAVFALGRGATTELTKHFKEKCPEQYNRHQKEFNFLISIFCNVGIGQCGVFFNQWMHNIILDINKLELRNPEHNFSDIKNFVSKQINRDGFANYATRGIAARSTTIAPMAIIFGILNQIYEGGEITKGAD